MTTPSVPFPPELHLIVGAPHCGKSHYAHRLLKRLQAVPPAGRTLRDTYLVDNPVEAPLSLHRFGKLVASRLRELQLVVVDDCNETVDKRAAVLKACLDAVPSCRVIVWYLSPAPSPTATPLWLWRDFLLGVGVGKRIRATIDGQRDLMFPAAGSAAIAALPSISLTAPDMTKETSVHALIRVPWKYQRDDSPSSAAASALIPAAPRLESSTAGPTAAAERNVEVLVVDLHEVLSAPKTTIGHLGTWLQAQNAVQGSAAAAPLPPRLVVVAQLSSGTTSSQLPLRDAVAKLHEAVMVKHAAYGVTGLVLCCQATVATASMSSVAVDTVAHAEDPQQHHEVSLVSLPSLVGLLCELVRCQERDITILLRPAGNGGDVEAAADHHPATAGAVIATSWSAIETTSQSLSTPAADVARRYVRSLFDPRALPTDGSMGRFPHKHRSWISLGALVAPHCLLPAGVVRTSGASVPSIEVDAAAAAEQAGHGAPTPQVAYTIVSPPALGAGDLPQHLAPKVKAPAGSTAAASARARRQAVATADSSAVAAPKRPQSAFFLYASEHRARVALAKGTALGSTVAAALGAEWRDLPTEAKAPYFEQAARLKAEYEAALQEHATMLAKMPPQQRSAAPPPQLTASPRETKSNAPAPPSAGRRGGAHSVSVPDAQAPRPFATLGPEALEDWEMNSQGEWVCAWDKDDDSDVELAQAPVPAPPSATKAKKPVVVPKLGTLAPAAQDASATQLTNLGLGSASRGALLRSSRGGLSSDGRLNDMTDGFDSFDEIAAPPARRAPRAE